MLEKALGDECMGKTQIKEWHKRFKNGRMSVDSGLRSGRTLSTLTPENIDCQSRSNLKTMLSAFFWNMKVLYAMNMLQEVRRSTRNFMLTF